MIVLALAFVVAFNELEFEIRDEYRSLEACQAARVVAETRPPWQGYGFRPAPAASLCFGSLDTEPAERVPSGAGGPRDATPRLQ